VRGCTLSKKRGIHTKEQKFRSQSSRTKHSLSHTGSGSNVQVGAPRCSPSIHESAHQSLATCGEKDVFSKSSGCLSLRASRHPRRAVFLSSHWNNLPSRSSQGTDGHAPSSALFRRFYRHHKATCRFRVALSAPSVVCFSSKDVRLRGEKHAGTAPELT